jgi:hypothetical protein
VRQQGTDPPPPGEVVRELSRSERITGGREIAREGAVKPWVGDSGPCLDARPLMRRLLVIKLRKARHIRSEIADAYRRGSGRPVANGQKWLFPRNLDELRRVE